jgi:hypothetical protein
MTVMSVVRGGPGNANVNAAIAVPVVHNLNAGVVTRLMVESVASAPGHAQGADGKDDQ